MVKENGTKQSSYKLAKFLNKYKFFMLVPG